MESENGLGHADRKKPCGCWVSRSGKSRNYCSEHKPETPPYQGKSLEEMLRENAG